MGRGDGTSPPVMWLYVCCYLLVNTNMCVVVWLGLVISGGGGPQKKVSLHRDFLYCSLHLYGFPFMRVVSCTL